MKRALRVRRLARRQTRFNAVLPKPATVPLAAKVRAVKKPKLQQLKHQRRVVVVVVKRKRERKVVLPKVPNELPLQIFAVVKPLPKV